MYSGELSSQIPRALGFIILGDVILCGIAAFFSSNPGAIGVEQDTPGAMLAVITAGNHCHTFRCRHPTIRHGHPPDRLHHIANRLVTFDIGIFQIGRHRPLFAIPGHRWFFGRLGLAACARRYRSHGRYAHWIRLVSSWHLNAMAPRSVTWIISRIVSQKVQKPYAIPLLMLMASLLFYAYTWMMKLSMADLRAAGWLLASLDSSSIWEFPLAPSFLSQVNWSVLLAQLPTIIPIAMICAIGLLFKFQRYRIADQKRSRPESRVDGGRLRQSLRRSGWRTGRSSGYQLFDSEIT